MHAYYLADSLWKCDKCGNYEWRQGFLLDGRAAQDYHKQSVQLSRKPPSSRPYELLYTAILDNQRATTTISIEYPVLHHKSATYNDTPQFPSKGDLMREIQCGVIITQSVFSKIFKKDTSKLDCQDEVSGVFSGFSLWVIFCLGPCNYVGNIMF